MIASQKIGKNFMGALNYNIKKLYHPDPLLRAELLATNFAAIDAKIIQQELNVVKSLRPNLNRYVYHTSLNFSKDDELTNAKMLEIAQEYLHRNGFNNNQFLIFRHHDADHPHLHLLVNRITFDGDVVSDSNNFKKSEAILRLMENKYGLVSVSPSSKVSQRAVTKDELEMINRTGKISEKLLLQELIKDLLKKTNSDIQMLIQEGEKLGVNFLFNQASTGRVTGISYFHNGFKIKGQALGNQFKWAELIKKVSYEQIRDSQAISEANKRTKAKYGEKTITNTGGSTINKRGSGAGVVSESTKGNPNQHSASNGIDYNNKSKTDAAGNIDGGIEINQSKTTEDDALDYGVDNIEYNTHIDTNVQISDDIDDEAIHGRNRHRQKKTRTNTR